MRQERYWERYDVNDENSDAESDTEEVADEGKVYQRRGPFSEVLRSVFISLFLLQKKIILRCLLLSPAIFGIEERRLQPIVDCFS